MVGQAVGGPVQLTVGGLAILEDDGDRLGASGGLGLDELVQAGGWQRFEVEITRAPRGSLRIAPTLSPSRIGVRNVGIYRIRE